MALRLIAVLLLSAGTAGCLNGPLIEQELDRGIYIGRQPVTAQDYGELRARGVRTILSLQAMPWDVWPERGDARDAGFDFVDVPMLAVPWPPPAESTMRRALTTMADRHRQPIFVHCRLGTDRASMVAALYRIYYLGWSPQDAWKKLVDGSFQVHGLHGYGTYFWEHTDAPEWAKLTAPAAASGMTDRSAPHSPASDR